MMRDYLVLQIKGRIRSYIAQEKEPLYRLVKYIQTICWRHGITYQDLEKILVDVKKESVDPFLISSKEMYQPQRLTRYEMLRRKVRV